MLTTSDGTQLAVHDLGGEGTPLLMVHATGMHGVVWAPVAHALAARFHCWSFDLRGHGDSTPPPSPPDDWTGFQRDIRAVVEHLGLRGGLAVGHSMGGANLLAVEAEHPGTFGALYVYEPAVFEGTGDQGGMTAQSIAVAANRREVFPSKAAAEERYGSRMPLSCFTPEALHAYVDHGFTDLPDGTVRLRCRAEVEAGVFAGFPRSGIVHRLHDVGCPVFLASGAKEDDAEATAERSVSLAAHLRHAEVVTIPGLNHFGPMQSPASLAASIQACFDRLA